MCWTSLRLLNWGVGTTCWWSSTTTFATPYLQNPLEMGVDVGGA
jgi:hypothetical protein